MGKLGLNSGYIGSDQRITTNGVVGYDKYYLERVNGRFLPVLEDDPDAQAFFDRVTAAGGILSATEKLAVTQLVTQMKLDGTWTPMKAIYPMVGASAAACAQNLKSSSFTGTFSTGWTFASTGVKGNGTSAYFNTGFNPSVDSSLSGLSFGGYPRNNDTSGTQVSGCTDGSSFVQNNLSAANILSGIIANVISYTANPSQRLIMHRRTSSTFAQAYRDGTSLGSDTATATTLPNSNYYIGARNEPTVSLYDAHEYAFYFFGLSLTNQNALDLTTAVNTFQTTLSRNV
jgi:hypothetical protein